MLNLKGPESNYKKDRHGNFGHKGNGYLSFTWVEDNDTYGSTEDLDPLLLKQWIKKVHRKEEERLFHLVIETEDKGTQKFFP